MHDSCVVIHCKHKWYLYPLLESFFNVEGVIGRKSQIFHAPRVLTAPNWVSYSVGIWNPVYLSANWNESSAWRCKNRQTDRHTDYSLRLRAHCKNTTQRLSLLKYTQWKSHCKKTNKKAQLTLSNPRDVKACKNCCNSTCFVSFHRIPFPKLPMHSFTRYVQSGCRPILLYTVWNPEIRCLPIIKFLV